MAHNTVDQGGRSYVDHQSGALCKIVWCKSSFSLESSFQYTYKSKLFQDLEKFKALRIVVRIGSGVDNIDVKVSLTRTCTHGDIYTPLLLDDIYPRLKNIQYTFLLSIT